MEAIKTFLAEYYWIFLVVGILLLITLIGFITSTKKKAKEQEGQATEDNITPEDIMQPQMPEPNAAPQEASPELKVVPSLDGLASSATEVKLGFDTAPAQTSIFESEEPTLIIEDTSNNQTTEPVQTINETVQPAAPVQVVEPQPVVQPTLVIEDPNSVQVMQPAAPVQMVQPQPVVQPTLVIEDPNPVQVMQPAAPVQVVEPQQVVQPTLVIEDPNSVQVMQPAAPVQVVEPQAAAEPVVGLVIEDPSSTTNQM